MGSYDTQADAQGFNRQTDDPAVAAPSLACARVYREFLGTCTQCGHCKAACESLAASDMTLGQIASALLEAERHAESQEDMMISIAYNERLMQAIRGCFFCTSCKNTCFAHNDVCELIYHARKELQNMGLIPREAWTSVQVDDEWDIFKAYRAIYGINLVDLARHLPYEGHKGEGDCEVAFFPGCALAAYAPDLTREIFKTIEELGGKTTLIDHCCGSPLKSAGFLDRAEALCDRNAEEIAASGAKTLVCVCPGCANAMKKTLQAHGSEVDVVSLSKFLADHGFQSKRPLPEGNIWISKSCQDRDGTYLEETCEVLGLDQQTPSIFYGCCGAGGAVSAFDSARQFRQADNKLSFAPDGATVVTMCPTCTYTYAYRMMTNPRDITNKHYTELLFEHQFDWDRVFAELEGMYAGEYGPWLAQVFA